jgi:hypothetical protein
MELSRAAEGHVVLLVGQMRLAKVGEFSKYRQDHRWVHYLDPEHGSGGDVLPNWTEVEAYE